MLPGGCLLKSDHHKWFKSVSAVYHVSGRGPVSYSLSSSFFILKIKILFN